MMTRREMMVVPVYGPNSDDCSSCTSSTCMTDEDEECIKSLLTLKHRSVTAEQLRTEKPAEQTSDNVYSYVRSRSVSTGSVNEEPPLDGKNDSVSFARSGSQSSPPTSMPLSHPDDIYWLSDLQCFVRSFCTEFFSASESDVTSVRGTLASKKPTSGPGSGGRRGPITLGRVGIRCVFCRDAHPSTRASQATSFPSQISGIYGAVVMMQCRHFPHCKAMPSEVRSKIAGLKRGGNSAPTHIIMDRGTGNGRQQYWADSARKLGLTDTEQGIRYKMDNSDMAPSPNCNPSFKPTHVSPDLVSHQASSTTALPDVALPASIDHMVKESSLVSLDDKDLVPDYLFLAIAQMKPCRLTEEDRVGCYKARNIGFLGMACKHCGGQPGFGKYFPATVRSLAQTTTSQTILKHVGQKCRMCPDEVRNAVNALLQESQKDANKPQHTKPCTNTQDGRPRYGSRKVFFQRVWGRLHGEYVPELPSHTMLDPSPAGPSLVSPHQEVSSVDSNDERSSSSEDDSMGGERPVRFYGEEDSDEDSDTAATDCLLDNKNRRITIRTTSSLPPRKKRRTNQISSLQ